jgi:hypothetical protein
MCPRILHVTGSVALLLAFACAATAQTNPDSQSLDSLKKLASRELNLSHQGNFDLDPDVQTSARALQRWYELDPQTGREAILHEITSPAPRFGADTLGILPDQFLASEQHVIARNYASARPGVAALPERPTRAEVLAHINRYNTFARQVAAEKHLASLLFRYATPDVLAEVLPALQERSAKPNCGAQAYMLAFLLKVDPSQATPLLRTAMENRPPGYSSCAQTMYMDIGNLIASPLLERFAIEALDDSDLFVAGSALSYLRDHGSAQAEQPVFDRLVSWNAQWRDHVSDLTGLPGQYGGDNFNTVTRIRINPHQTDISFCIQLVQTLANGHGWIASADRIRQLLPLTLEPAAKGNLMGILSQLRESPIHIYCLTGPSFTFSVAQYQLNSLDDLESKLTQYPPGTSFIWVDRRLSVNEPGDNQMSLKLLQWSAANGIRIAGL